MDPIKEAFHRAKTDILSLKEAISDIKSDISDIKRTLDRQTDRQTNQTHPQIEQKQTPIQPSIPPYSSSSMRNDGVQTDRQTDRQTDTSTQRFAQTDQINHIEDVSKVLDSLDSLKKEIRYKFKHLTTQEMLVFSQIYTLEDQGLSVDYSLISQKISLSESSVRDYVQKLIKKGVPIVKTKRDNKRVTLNIHEDLLKIASLNTIQQLRNI